ncbi:MAG: 30S ribosomal protein S6 [Minisyncoccia bacterium]
MRSYNLTFLITTKLSEEEAEEYIKKIESLISQEGSILNSELKKKINLAYEIKKQKEAFLKSIDFTFPEDKISDLKNSLQKEENILRFLINKI